MTKRPKVTVLGSLNMDISVTVPRLPGPGVTVLGSAARFTPGGKGANQAVAAARLGAGVRMVGCVGDDDFGRALRAALRAEGVDDSAVRTAAGVPTASAMDANRCVQSSEKATPGSKAGFLRVLSTSRNGSAGDRRFKISWMRRLNT